MGISIGGVCFQGYLTLMTLRSAETADANADDNDARRQAYEAVRKAVGDVPLGVSARR
jgi:uncharacterized protein YdbL (DUF1318 family)